jgi:hypothetical protein
MKVTGGKRMKHKVLTACVMMAALAATASFATAAVIVAPVAGGVYNAWPMYNDVLGRNTSPIDSFNQSGLSSFYVSGVTDFDVYLGTNPTHAPFYMGFDWYRQSNLNYARRQGARWPAAA